jgi:hypothetical protein
VGDVRIDKVVQVAMVRPGDTLIVRVPHDAEPEECLRIRAQMQESLPGVTVRMLAGADELVIYRPGGLLVQPDDVVAVHPDSPEPLIVHGSDIAVLRPEATP